MALYEAQLSFSSPHASRRFRQHVVYDLDDDLVTVLGEPIRKGWLVPVSAAEYEGFSRSDQIDPDGAGTPPAQDSGGQGDGGDDAGEAPTPPADHASTTQPSSPAVARPDPTRVIDERVDPEA